MHLEEEEEPGDFGLDSLITGVEVAEVVKQLCIGSALRVNEIHPKLLKSPDGPWKLAQPVHILIMDPETDYDRVLRGVLWGVFLECGLDGLFFNGPFDLCIAGARAWFALLAVYQTHFQSGLIPPKAILCHQLCS